MDNSTPNMAEMLVLHLDGELKGAEKQAMEEQLAADTALKTQWQSLLETRAAIQHYGLTKRVRSLHGKMMEEMQAPVRKPDGGKKILRYSMAAAASLVLLVGGYLAYAFFSLSPEKVFSANYRTYELSIMRDDNAPAASPVEKAFAEKNYPEILRIHEAGGDHTLKEDFLCGVAALEIKNNTKAIQFFRKVLDANAQTGQRILTDESEFYLSLGYIRNKDYDFALALLAKIKNDPEHKYYREVSARLIRKVKMLKWR